MRTRGRLSLLCLSGAMAIAITGSVAAQKGAATAEWRHYSGDAGATKYSPLDQINSSNVTRLRVAWRRPGVDRTLSSRVPDFRFSNNFRSTPLMVDGVLYASNGIGLIEAFHPGTGATLWVQEPFPQDGAQAVRGDSKRSLAYWTAGSERRLLTVQGEYLVAVDAKNGRPVEGFGDGGRVNLTPGIPRLQRYSWTGVPVVCRDVVIVGAAGFSDAPRRKENPPGDVQAFDVRTGRPKWTFHAIPRQGEFGVDTWLDRSWEYSGNANLWSLLSADEELGYAYLPLTSPSVDMYGGHRPGDNLFGNSLVAVRCDTGARVWHQQLVRHDLWDYDLPAAPVLADITVDGKAIKAVVQVTKQAFAFVFDRVTGQPVWPIEERPVPQSDTPGERTAATQPFPTKPLPFDRQGVTTDDLIDFTPELRAEALEIVKQYRLGPMFTPPSVPFDGPGGTRGTLQNPGSAGGADWQGAAFDPETRILYVQSITGPFVADIVPGDPNITNLRFTSGQRAYPAGPRQLPLLKPPYGRITAIDLNKGDHVWMAANGDGPRDHPLLKPLNLPPLGNPGRAAPVVTKTLLFVGEGSPVMGRAQRVPVGMPPSQVPSSGDKKFRAYDKATGKVLWVTELDAGTTGAPMTYMFDGKQYVVVAIGSADHAGEFIAFSLP